MEHFKILKSFGDRKGTTKKLYDKDFAERSGELCGAICLKPLFYWIMTDNPLELFRKFFGAVRPNFWLCRSFLALNFQARLNISSVWFAKPMAWVRVAFHENDGNHENDEDDSDSYRQGVECWIRGNHGNRENDENPRESRVQTTGSPNHAFRNTRQNQSAPTGAERASCGETVVQKGVLGESVSSPPP